MRSSSRSEKTEREREKDRQRERERESEKEIDYNYFCPTVNRFIHCRLSSLEPRSSDRSRPCSTPRERRATGALLLHACSWTAPAPAVLCTSTHRCTAVIQPNARANPLSLLVCWLLSISLIFSSLFSYLPHSSHGTLDFSFLLFVQLLYQSLSLSRSLSLFSPLLFFSLSPLHKGNLFITPGGLSSSEANLIRHHSPHRCHAYTFYPLLSSISLTKLLDLQLCARITFENARGILCIRERTKYAWHTAYENMYIKVLGIIIYSVYRLYAVAHETP